MSLNLPSQFLNVTPQKTAGGRTHARPEPSLANAQHHQQAVSNQKVHAQLAHITMSMQMMQAKIDQILNILNRTAQRDADFRKLEQMAHAAGKAARGM